MEHLAKLKEAILKRDYQETAMNDKFNHLNHRKHQTKKKKKLTLKLFGHNIKSDLPRL